MFRWATLRCGQKRKKSEEKVEQKVSNVKKTYLLTRAREAHHSILTLVCVRCRT